MSTKNVAASIRQRLLNLSRQSGEDFQLVFNRYVVERLLFRLGESEFSPRFVLKGAMLFALWTGAMHRPTRDLDLLGFGDSSAEELASIFRSLCSISVEEDGLVFAPETVTVEPIREDQVYGGQRVTIDVRLGTARLKLQVDVGFGDAITPHVENVHYPTLLDMQSPHVRAYPRETVVAEKLEAMVSLGLANTRMKDFYDLVVLARRFHFDGTIVSAAIAATFSRRGTPIPDALPLALTDQFAWDPLKRQQWAAFGKRTGLNNKIGEIDEVVAELAQFVGPPLFAAGRSEAFRLLRKPGGPWE